MTRNERLQRKRLLIAVIVVLTVMLASVANLVIVLCRQMRCNCAQKSVVEYHEDGSHIDVDYPQATIEDDPLETEHINDALFATGYLRHDVPLSIGDQLALRASSDWYGVPYSLCLGVIEGECNFNAENDNGHCYGLMALNRDYFPDDLESWQNIQYGVECLANKLKECNGDVPSALESYWNGNDDGRRGYPEYILEFAEKWEALGVDTYEEAG